MSDPFIRTRLLIGDEPLDRLARAKVAVFGVGGVGGFCVEALARAGVGALDLYDDDTVSESNLNRQLAALRSAIGQPKAEVLARRVADINPDCTRTQTRWTWGSMTMWWTASTPWPPSWTSPSGVPG